MSQGLTYRSQFSWWVSNDANFERIRTRDQSDSPAPYPSRITITRAPNAELNHHFWDTFYQQFIPTMSVSRAMRQISRQLGHKYGRRAIPTGLWLIHAEKFLWSVGASAEICSPSERTTSRLPILTAQAVVLHLESE